jgi:vacuolar-type H+-ATPase subunit F/Vma7
MSELVVIAPGEMAIPLRLAGLDVLPARNAAEAYERALDIRAIGDAQLVLFPEHFVAGLSPEATRLLLSSDDPYFVPVPMDWRNRGDARVDFEFRLGRILGCRIKLAESRRGSSFGGRTP